ncbi:porin [Duganella radicis]|nr:porin [Duganella radicis]
MKTVLASIALMAPLAAIAQSGVYRAIDPNPVDSKPFDSRVLEGLDGPLGLGALGRQYNLMDDTQVGALKRYDSTIQFKSPRSRSGLVGSMSYSVGEAPFNNWVNRAYGATIGYEKGRASISITHQRKENMLDATGTTPAVDQSARNTLVAANVDFGRFIGYAAYGLSKGDSSLLWDQNNLYGAVARRDPLNNSRDVLVGVSVPMGATTFLASYIHRDDRGLADHDANQFALGASYAFSRRTKVFTSFTTIQNRSVRTGGGNDRAVNFGLKHAF